MDVWMIELALGLRWLHWGGIGLLLAGLLAFRWSGRTRWRFGVAGLGLAAGSAVAWPAAYAAAMTPGNVPWQILLVLGAGAEGWLPGMASLLDLHPAWVSTWRPEPAVPVAGSALRQASWLLVTLLLASGCVWLAWRTSSGPLGWMLLALATVLWGYRPIPSPALLLAPASVYSFRQPDVAFDVAGLSLGQVNYQRHCIACHGVPDEGPVRKAAGMARWPTMLGAALFETRPAGELYGHVQYAAGHAFSQRLNETEVWQILDYLRAAAAGTTLQREQAWLQPLPAPGMSLRCTGAWAHARFLSDLRGQTVRIAVQDGGASAVATRALPDPRLVDVWLLPPGAGMPAEAECVSTEPGGRQVYGWLAGVVPGQLSGAAFLVDRQGWLRAFASARDAQGWSRPDSMCGPGDTAVAALSSGSLSDVLDTMARRPVEPLPGARL
ncbi:MAG: c-type cytochrome [Corticimicrobacter sp.]|uniref:c-type cytochrome n=1 Tax=Corticimicrobacter sp. TaxID=2678536 RepID=UPI0032DBE908